MNVLMVIANLVGGVVEDRNIVIDVDDFDTDNHRPRLRRVTAVTGYHDYLIAEITTAMAIKFIAHAPVFVVLGQ